jgi:beta-N-acetylhexosaminidase
MTPEQKIGQVMMVGFDGTEASPDLLEMITKYHVGGVILFARNIESPEQVARLTGDLQRAALDSGHPGLFIAIDQEGGRVARLTEDKGFTEVPGAMAIAATGDVASAQKIAAILAGEMNAIGVNIDFAPDLDVNNNPQNPVIGLRSYGSQPDEVAKFGVATIQALQSNGILAVGKHFPGHGDTGTDSHVALPLVPHDRARLEQVEFVPFEAAMLNGVAGIMSAHIVFPAIDPTPGLPATLSPAVLTGLLRQEMGFQGLIFTDSLDMGALGEAGYPTPLAAATALKAGADVLLMNRDYVMHKLVICQISTWLEEGDLPPERLDDAVRRVLDFKERFHVLKPALVDPAAAAGRCGTNASIAISRDIANRSITLLRDAAGLLPLRQDTRYLVVEMPAAQGLGRALRLTSQSVSAEPTDAEIRQVIGLAKGNNNDPRVVILPTSDANRSPAQAALGKALLDAGIPTIAIAIRNPYDILAYPSIGTYLVTYGANPPAFEALSALMWGKITPSGRLPVEIPGLFQPGDGSQNFHQ